ncbi:MAG: chemotaxis protein methyltransferase CheR [Bacteroidetes bacterium]|nr:MAG: chemotaxis protein methyltransferase CheR [Bacteroidota bacterium]
MEHKNQPLRPFDVFKLPAEFQLFDGAFLERTIRLRMNSLAISDFEDYLSILITSEQEKAALFEMVSNSHSLFFRNSLTFSVLENISLPGFLIDLRSNKMKELRIWSTACASGQEVYSLAILLEELKLNSNIDFTYRIFASDHSETQIKLAKAGLFTNAALGNTTLKRIETWFTHEKHGYRIKSSLQNHIIFSTFDLLDEKLYFPQESVYGEFNLVICANLLFYYAPDYQQKILKKLRNVLLPNGCFVSGETERAIVAKNGFVEKYPQSAVYRMK